ncbi:hypothetical protein [Cryptosporangium aurantiacum]|uniref:Lipoprotein n=1 Tax=Cryptosporangium aurantiacum TaxID=134849 RepID=A0A1M7QVJ2_9ACTN|nr:hypothetical protein [Cryptosporangium aurantiacum]SHN35925.1 hypothetical protein SAMN05443668_105456 [Cryptosporangium aurantiacum]
MALVLTLTPSGCSHAAENDGTGASSTPQAAAPASQEPVPKPRPELPLGGRTIFPRYRVVAYYGSIGGGTLGVLGEEPPDAIVPRLRAAAAPFATPERPVQIAFELIVRIADRKPGPRGIYSHSIKPAVIRQYIEAAERAKALVILDIQPGRLSFPDAIRPYRWALEHPNVGIALDPEWRVAYDEVPGKVVGQVSAAEVNEASAYVADIVREKQLPEKLFLLHQFRLRMLPDVERILPRRGLAMVQHVDGFGTRKAKDATYAAVRRPEQFHLGYKLFYDEDVEPYGPSEVLAFSHPPEYVSYQ